MLRELGLTDTAAPAAELVMCSDARTAVDGAQCVQESIPERVGLKHEIYGQDEDTLADDAIVATSSSGLTLGGLQAG